MSKEHISRHGVRAAGKTSTTVSLEEAILDKARALAAEDGRSFSNWLERLLVEKLRETRALKVADEPTTYTAAKKKRRSSAKKSSSPSHGKK